MTNNEKNDTNTTFKTENKPSGKTENKPSGKQTAKMQREQRLANALRKNLGRRKQAKSNT